MSARGTVDFTYKGKKLKLRLDIQGIEDTEDMCNCSINLIGNNALNGQGIKFKHLKTIVWAGIAGYYRDKDCEFDAPTLEEVGTYIYEKIGTTDVNLLDAVRKLLIFSITTEDEIKENEKRVKAEAKTKKKEKKK